MGCVFHHNKNNLLMKIEFFDKFLSISDLNHVLKVHMESRDEIQLLFDGLFSNVLMHDKYQWVFKPPQISRPQMTGECKQRKVGRERLCSHLARLSGTDH